MFRKAQWKFFSYTTLILIAIFIALLAAVNLIMNSVTQHQSIVVLKQIAENVEYDEKTNNFVYFDIKRPPIDEQGHGSKNPNMSPGNVFTEEKTNMTSKVSKTETSSSAAATTKTAVRPVTEAEIRTGAETQTRTVAEERVSVTTKVQPKTQMSASNMKITTEAAVSNKPEIKTAAATNAVVVKPTAAPVTTKAAAPPPQQQATAAPPKKTTAADIPPQQYMTTPDRPWNEEWQRPPFHDDGPRPPEWEDFTFSDEENPTIESPEPPHYEWDDPYWHWGNEEFSENDAEKLSASNVPVLNGYTVVMEEPHIDDKFGKREEAPVPKSLGSIDFFVLMADVDGEFLASLNNDDLTQETAQSYIDGVLSQNSEDGMFETLQFFIQQKENGTLMVFTDKAAEMDMLDQLMKTTIAIGAVSLVLLSILTYFLSKKNIEPIKIAFDKQKQFISDASHELKTPLTVISANADVLSGEVGENKWLEYIKAQTDRMNILVNELLNLTRLENNTIDFSCGEFNLSKAVENAALPFECQAFETNKKFEVDIQEDLTIVGSERHVKQMTAIFIDNALKYSKENGTVRVTLKEQNDKKILSVYNTGSGIKESEIDKIFERFYRSDSSRARTTGGYGLGLAIAKTIIDKHKFKLTIDNVEGESICFNVIM